MHTNHKKDQSQLSQQQQQFGDRSSAAGVPDETRLEFDIASVKIFQAQQPKTDL